MSKDVRDLLSDPYKGTTRAKGILCYLFREVLLWRRVNQFTWNKYARIYLKKPHNEEKADKGNLNKKLVQDEMSWGTFKNAVDFLNPVSATLTVRMYWRSGRVSSYSVIIDPAEDETDPALNDLSGKDEGEIFKGKKPPTGTLTRLFHRMVREEGIDSTRWDGLMREYVTREDSGITQNRQEIANAIGNTNRELLSPKMTWNLLRKGLTFLGSKDNEYILTLRWSQDETDISTHSIRIRDPLTIIPPSEARGAGDVKH